MHSIDRAANLCGLTPFLLLLLTPAWALAAESAPAAEEAALEDGGKAKEIAGVQQQNFVSEFCESFKKPDPTGGTGYEKMRAFCSKSGAERTKEIGK